MSMLARVRAISVAVTLVITSACPSGGGKPEVNWPAYVQCLPDPHALVGTISDILFHDSGFKNTLEDLARAEGPNTVVCVVDQLVKDWSARGASATPERAVATARGREFLTHTGTRTSE